MASSSNPTPFLPLNIPLSPLVGGAALTEDFFATLVAQGTLKPLPNLCFSPPRRTQAVAVKPAQSCDREKSLPAAPPLHIPPRQIISLLDLLERMDNDVMKEVQRVRESIKEARTEIAGYRHERDARGLEVTRRKARERRETKGLDDEFWLQV